jgi:hypothetical protein
MAEFENIAYIMKLSDFKKIEKSQMQLEGIEWAKEAIKKKKSYICVSAGKFSVDFMLTPKQKEQVLDFIEEIVKK